MHITKLFNGKVEDLESGTIIHMPWEILTPAIKEYVRLREDEVIDGFIVTEESIKIKLSRKKGRKVKL